MTSWLWRCLDRKRVVMAGEPTLRLSQKVARFFLKKAGWQLVGQIAEHPKCIIIGAHHTSNWDFVYAMLVKFSLGHEFHWIGKAAIFSWPFGGLMRKLGGIPVWREKRSNFVYQIVEAFNKADQLRIVIAPEGTRKQAPYWKSGFYYMALGARVPIVLGFIDYHKKQIGFGPTLIPNGNIQDDFAKIRDFYADKQGLYPQNHSEVMLRPMNTSLSA